MSLQLLISNDKFVKHYVPIDNTHKMTNCILKDL